MKSTSQNKFINCKLFEYLELDIEKKEDISFFKSIFAKNDVVIFGGLLRDIIAGKKPNDMDILSLPRSINNIQTILIKNGYEIQNPDYNTLENSEYYKELKIFIPLTAKKGNHILQFIKPNDEEIYKQTDLEVAFKYLFYLVGQVDLSCCGLCWSWKFGFEEVIPNAIKHAKHRIFEIFPKNIFYTTRTKNRIKKLENNGWFQI